MKVTFNEEIVCYFIPEENKIDYREESVSEIIHTTVSQVKKCSRSVFKEIGENYMTEEDREQIKENLLYPGINKIVDSVDYIITDIMSFPVVPRKGYIQVLVEFVDTLLEEFKNRNKLYMVGLEPEHEEINCIKLHIITQRSTQFRGLKIDQAISFIDNNIGLYFSND